MAKILPFPVEQVFPDSGLTDHQCEAVHATACALMHQGRATGVSDHNDGQYMCVFNCRGEPYRISRVDGVYHLFDHDEIMAAHSIRFEAVLGALKKMLSSPQEISV